MVLRHSLMLPESNKQYMKNKLLIVAPYQFGELTDCYYWAKYATQAGWDVTYLGYRYRYREIKERTCPGVRVVGVMHSSNRTIHGLKFLGTIIKEILINNYKNVILCRFPKCEILSKLFPNRNIVLDVRTLSVSPDKDTRERADNELRRIMKYFKTTTVISQGVGEKLGGGCPILPLGAEPLSMVAKDFSSLRLFYIGTFNNRNLSQFIEGLALYQRDSGDSSITFDVVGGGSPEEEKMIHDTISRTGVSGVNLHGYLTHDEAKQFFDRCNVGVCYVPVTEYYQHQPPTKLYEYLLSGMSCIATNTISNLEVMNSNNGVVVSDNPEAVADGLLELKSQMKNYQSDSIGFSSQQYHWRNIVEKSLLPIFES